MHLRTLFLAAALAVPLASCAGLTSTASVAQPVEYVCSASTAALKTAIAFNAKLTPAQRVKITAATQVLDPYCSAPNPPTVSAVVLTTLKNAGADLGAIAAVVSK